MSPSQVPSRGDRRAELGLPPDPEPEKPVILHAAAYKSIILYESRYANKSLPREEWKEIYGILIGYLDPDRAAVVVERAEPLHFGASTDVHLEPHHYAQIAEIEEKVYLEGGPADEPARFVVGWFHSHPGLSLFFSLIDIYNQLGFQDKNPDAVGLVFDHTYLEREQDHPGFEIYRLTDATMSDEDPRFDRNYHRVPYTIEHLSEFFFANVLADLSARSTAKEPLEYSYGEKADAPLVAWNPVAAATSNEPAEMEGSVATTTDASRDAAMEGPPVEEAGEQHSVNGPVPLPTPSKESPGAVPGVGAGPVPGAIPLDELAGRFKGDVEREVFEGRKAYQLGDAFSAIEHFNRALETLRSRADEPTRLLEVLDEFADLTLKSNHVTFTEQTVAEMLATIEKTQVTGGAGEDGVDLGPEGRETQTQLAYFQGAAHLYRGQILVKQAQGHEEARQAEILSQAMVALELGAKFLSKGADHAGAGLCYNQIAEIQYHFFGDYFSAAMFYIEAAREYKAAIRQPHPRRSEKWTQSRNLEKMLRGLTSFVRTIIDTKIHAPRERAKLESGLQALDGPP